jgi:DNA-binding CsgD family transcriptional regulator
MVLVGISGVAWIVRALASGAVSPVLDDILLGVMLVGSAAASGPSYSTSVYPMAGSLVIMLAKTEQPRWVRWVWPLAAVVAAAVGFSAGHRELWSIAITTLTIAIATLAGLARRASFEEVARRFDGLDRAYAFELARVQASADRLLTVKTLRARYPELTPREAETLALICRGRSNEQIAGDLYISVATVKGYVNSLFTKIPAAIRAHAIALVLGTVHPGTTA